MLVLDSEALSAAAHGPDPRRRRVRALIDEARHGEEHVLTSTAVLAEVVRGRPPDAGVSSALRRHRIDRADVDRAVAVRAGALLETTGAGSELAVDAFLVATADRGRPARIVTGDLGDIRMLVDHCRSVSVEGVDAP